MDTETLEKQEIIERIAFERGRQIGLSGGAASTAEVALEDLLTVEMSTLPVYDAYFRGQVYGERQAEHEFAEGED